MIKDEFNQVPDPFGTRFPLTGNLRFKLFFTGVVVSGFNIASSIGGASATGLELWQSGTTEDYVALFLASPAILFFLPLMLFSMVSLCAITWCPRLKNRLWVRLGIYTGAVLSIQYFIAVLLTTGVVTLMASAIFGPLLALFVWLVTWTVRQFKRFTIKHLLAAMTVAAILLVIIPALGIDPWSFFFTPLILIFISGPTLNLFTYCRTAVALLTDRSAGQTTRRKFPFAASIAGWLVAYFIAWRFSIEQVLLEYAKLPTTGPNCYIASAAANGNPKLVGSRTVKIGENEAILNLQMQRLKFLEFAIQTKFPKTHRFTRALYNFFGPKLAVCCGRSRSTANLAFLTLKPIEYFAAFLRAAIGIPRERVTQIYLNSKHNSVS